MSDTILKSFAKPDERMIIKKGELAIVHLGGVAIGRATYDPGWKWSVDVGRGIGASKCVAPHLGMVVSGVAATEFENGDVVECRAGELFLIPPVPHDSWVVGNEPYVSITFWFRDEHVRALRDAGVDRVAQSPRKVIP